MHNISRKNVPLEASVADPDETDADFTNGSKRSNERTQRHPVESLDETTRRQMRAEAARCAGTDAALRTDPEVKLIPLDELIKPQSDSLYQLPAWLEKTATADQVAGLAELFNELREWNVHFAGESVKEVEAYFGATGLHLDLVERVRDWCGQYVRRRASPANMNPQVGSHPFDLHCSFRDFLSLKRRG